MILLYHNDFDGLASAAILRKHLRTWGITTQRCVPVDYGTSWFPWPEASANDGFAVVDFQYHPHAIVWIDHHATTFSSPGLRSHFQLRQQDGDAVVWDAQAPSCAQAIASWTGNHHPTVVTAANKVDQARFSDPDEYILSRAPEIDLMHTNRSMTSAQRDTIMDALEEDDLEGAGWVMRKEAEEAQQQRAEFLSISRNNSWLSGTVVMCDATEHQHVRFSTFKFFPEAEMTCVVAARKTGGYLINMYKNPWKPPTTVNIGVLLQSYGGGGHANAGVVQFPTGTSGAVWGLARELAQIVQAY